jgi:hypothetical protein
MSIVAAQRRGLSAPASRVPPSGDKLTPEAALRRCLGGKND